MPFIPTASGGAFWQFFVNSSGELATIVAPSLVGISGSTGLRDAELVKPLFSGGGSMLLDRAAGDQGSQNFVTGTGSFEPFPSQNTSFESTPLLTRYAMTAFARFSDRLMSAASDSNRSL